MNYIITMTSYAHIVAKVHCNYMCIAINMYYGIHYTSIPYHILQFKHF